MADNKKLRFDRPVGIAVEGVDFFHLLRSRYDAGGQPDLYLYDWCDLGRLENEVSEDRRGKVLGRWLAGVADQNGNTTFRLRTLGIIVDAEDDASGTFLSAQSQLQNAGFGKPAEVGTIALSSKSLPSVAVLVVPVAQMLGCLEHALLDSLTETKFCPPVSQFAEQAEKAWGDTPPRCLISETEEDRHNWNKSMDRWRAKLKVHAHIAASRRPESTLGESARMNLWDFDGPGLKAIIGFIEMLRQHDAKQGQA